MTRKNCIHFLAVVFLAGIQFSSAQSTSESVASLRNSTDTCMAVFVQALKGAGSNPKHLLDGDLSAKAESAKSDLEALIKQIDSQTDFITKKEVGIGSRGLSESEKKELLTILAGQKKPLQDLKGRVAMFQQKLAQFTKTDASRWKETYSSFESISGPQRAGEKLKSEIEAFLKSIPIARELEKYKPADQLGEGTLAPPKGSTLHLQGGISIGGASNESQLGRTTSPANVTTAENLVSDKNQPPKPITTHIENKSFKEESFFKFPRWFAVPMILMFLALILSMKGNSDTGFGCFFSGMTLLTLGWLIWLIYLWVLRVIA